MSPETTTSRHFPTPTRQNTTRRIPLHIHRRILELAAGGASPGQIHQELKKEFPAEPVSLRTVERIFKADRRSDSTAPWTLLSGTVNPRTAAAVIELIPVLMEGPGGRDHVTQREAAALERVLDILPEARAIDAWYLAHAYLRRQEQGDQTADLDVRVSFWRRGLDKEAAMADWQPPSPSSPWPSVMAHHAAFHAANFPDRAYWAPRATVEHLSALEDAITLARERGDERAATLLLAEEEHLLRLRDDAEFMWIQRRLAESAEEGRPDAQP